MYSILVPAIISILVSLVVTWSTIKWQWKQVIRERNYDKKRDIFLRAHRLIYNLFDNNDIVYSDEYIKDLKETRYELYIYGTEKVYKCINPFIQTLLQYRVDYDNYLSKAHEYIEVDIGHITSQDFEALIKDKIDSYIINNFIPKDEIGKKMKELKDIIREELDIK